MVLLKLVNPSVEAFIGKIGTSEILIIDDETTDDVFGDGFEGE
jgi:hypothetical protein